MSSIPHGGKLNIRKAENSKEYWNMKHKKERDHPGQTGRAEA